MGFLVRRTQQLRAWSRVETPWESGLGSQTRGVAKENFGRGTSISIFHTSWYQQDVYRFLTRFIEILVVGYEEGYGLLRGKMREMSLGENRASTAVW